MALKKHRKQVANLGGERHSCVVHGKMLSELGARSAAERAERFLQSELCPMLGQMQLPLLAEINMRQRLEIARSDFK